MVFTCPMHPQIRVDHSGRCPECGMQLVPTQQTFFSSTQHNKHAGHNTKQFLSKFWICLVLSIPTIIFSELPQELFVWQAPKFWGSQFIPLILGSIIFFYGGLIFLQSAWRELRGKLPGMMTLISLAITAAYVFSVYAALSGESHTLFWELASLITIMLLGHYLEMRSVKGVQGALQDLAALLPDTAEVIRSGATITIPLSDLRVGDKVLVRPGSTVPADGEIIEGKSEVNESMITGESKPVERSVGNMVLSGTINGDGGLTLEVKFIGEKTYLAGVIRLVKEAETSKSKLQILSDRVAFYLTITAVTIGLITLIVWISIGAGPLIAVERMVAVLVATCPHALGLAVPLVAAISTTLAARNGFLIKQRLALESARAITAVLFDKTGTLTTGMFGITDMVANAEAHVSEARLLQIAASVNSQSEHALAKAMVTEARKRNLEILESTNFQRLPGRGSSATVENKKIVVGGPKLLEEFSLNVPDNLISNVQRLNSEGKTIIYIIIENKIEGVIALADMVRSESKAAIKELTSLGIMVTMITGDSTDVAAQVAKELDIKEYFAQVLPEDKVSKVKLLQQKGFKVAMVGDGINDAPSLAQADVGIAIGAGTNVAIESAGIILAKNDPRDIPKIIRLSRFTYNKMIQNLFWATGYNIIVVPLAAGVLVKYGILLPPAGAALLMSLSTIIVAFNAILLKGKKI